MGKNFEIPDDWRINSFNQLLKNGILSKIQDGNHGNDHPKASDYVEDGIPFVMANCINANHHLDLSKCNKISRQQYLSLRIGFSKPNDVLLTHKGSIGLTGIVPEHIKELMLTPQVTLYRVANLHELYNVYLYYYFQSNWFQTKIKRLSGQSTRAYVGITEQKKLFCILPPIEEQRRIAEILGTWDSAIALTENLIAAKQKKKRYFIKRFFQSSDSDNLFDKAKKLIKLREVVTKIGSGITPRGGRKVYLSEGIALIRSQNVQSGYLDISDVVFIDETQHFKMQNSKVYPSDVLLNITGASIGRSCVVPKNIKEANVNQHVCILRPSQKINPHYLSIFLNSYQGQKQILSFQVGGSREGLNYQQVSNLRLNLPSIDEQNKIANFLACLEHEIRLLGFIREKFKLQKRGLMQKLLTGEWRVKIEKAGQQLTELKT